MSIFQPHSSSVCADLVRSRDWSLHPLGMSGEWPSSLKMALNMIFQSEHPMFLFWGPDHFCFYNDAYLPSFGTGRHPNAMGQKAKDCWPEIWDVIGPQIQLVMSGAGATWHENQLLPIIRNGALEDVYWTYSYSPFFNEVGEIAATLVVCMETTKTVRAVQELERARSYIDIEQTKFRTIFEDSSTSMAVLKGENFVYEIANKSYLELFNNRDLIGRPFLEALPELIGQEFPERAQSVYKTGVPYVDVEAKAFLKRTSDGPLEERYFDQTYTRMHDVDGSPYGVFIHAREVTDRVRSKRELEESAERFRIAIETADMGTWDLDPQTQVVNWSDRTNELFGVDRKETLPLEAALKRIHPDDVGRVGNEIAAAIDPRGNGNYQIEYRINHDNGETRWVSLRGKAFFEDTPRGRITKKFTGTILDVTERRMAEVALREAKERAEMANLAKSSFLANMSHEIRTPLGAIMGFVSLIRDEGVSPKMVAEYASVIERNSVQLMRIIDDILDLSKVEAGMMLIEHVDFSLIELLSDFSSLMGFRAREKGVLFEVKARTELPNIINSDPTRLRQILTNIVGNAIKFTDQGAVQLRICYNDDYLDIEVEDTGRGISEEQISNLFQPFSQGDVSTTRKYGGTGLGLVLTRRLCEGMGGDFNLKRSELGKGSIFLARLKVGLTKETQMVKALGFASEPIRNAGGPTLLQGLKVLLVEDSLDNQSLFSIYLGRAGAKLDIASDGSQGFEMAMGGEYDVVLMDVQMPVMDGITAVKKLRSAGYGKPVIALTAHAMKEERQRCLDAGYTEFLSKPIQRQDLIETLSKYV